MSTIPILSLLLLSLALSPSFAAQDLPLSSLSPRSLQLFPSSSLDCNSCYTKSSTARYCLSASNEQYCCSSNDTACGANSTCTGSRTSAVNFFYTYCKGASDPLTCGVDALDLVADATVRKVTVTSLPSYVTTSRSPNYLACYYHVKGDDYTWKSGAKIKVTLTAASNVQVYLFGGTTRINASIAVTLNNASLVANQSYTLDISTEAVLLVVPSALTNTNYTFTYQIEGTKYNWWQRLLFGKDGQTYFIVVVALASFIGLLVLVLIVVLIVNSCSRNKAKTNQVQTLHNQHKSAHVDVSTIALNAPPKLNEISNIIYYYLLICVNR